MKDLYLQTFKKYTQFTGRASKKEFWTFIGINIIVSIVLGILFGLIDMPAISSIFSLIILLPSLAVGFRRMHDIGKPGWYSLIPFYNIYLAIQDGEPVENEHGKPRVV